MQGVSSREVQVPSDVWSLNSSGLDPVTMEAQAKGPSGPPEAEGCRSGPPRASKGSTALLAPSLWMSSLQRPSLWSHLGLQLQASTRARPVHPLDPHRHRTCSRAHRQLDTALGWTPSWVQRGAWPCEKTLPGAGQRRTHCSCHVPPHPCRNELCVCHFPTITN